MRRHATPNSRPTRGSNSGFTFIEVLVATLVVGLAIGAVLEANSVVLALGKKSHDVDSAMLYAQERIETLRNVTWLELTSSSYFTTQYFATVPMSAAGLSGPGNITETVTVEPYGAGATGTAMIIQSAAGGAPQVLQAGSGLPGQLMGRVCVNIQWTGNSGITHQHEVDTIISSSSGITTASLPAMGAFAGGAFNTSSSGSTSTSSSSSTTTTTTTTTTGNNGNGNGQGNVGGKSSKG
jgi:prepilin-type N-terminal cleavage/methylation domain-containing protein